MADQGEAARASGRSTRPLVAIVAWLGCGPWACTDGGSVELSASPSVPRNSDGSPQTLPPGPPSRPPHALVLAYDDFGPQALAGTLLGQDWWQWEGGGSWEPGDRFDVRVVVHRGLRPEEVAAEYPTVVGRADYRYVSHAEALAFLEGAIADLEGDPSFERLCAQLRATRTRIQRALGP